MSRTLRIILSLAALTLISVVAFAVGLIVPHAHAEEAAENSELCKMPWGLEYRSGHTIEIAARIISTCSVVDTAQGAQRVYRYQILIENDSSEPAEIILGGSTEDTAYKKEMRFPLSIRACSSMQYAFASFSAPKIAASDFQVAYKSIGRVRFKQFWIVLPEQPDIWWISTDSQPLAGDDRESQGCIR